MWRRRIGDLRNLDSVEPRKLQVEGSKPSQARLIFCSRNLNRKRIGFSYESCGNCWQPKKKCKHADHNEVCLRILELQIKKSKMLNSSVYLMDKSSATEDLMRNTIRQQKMLLKTLWRRMYWLMVYSICNSFFEVLRSKICLNM